MICKYEDATGKENRCRLTNGECKIFRDLPMSYKILFLRHASLDDKTCGEIYNSVYGRDGSKRCNEGKRSSAR